MIKKIIPFLCILISQSIFALDSQHTAQEILHILSSGESRGYIGEDVTQLQHALQAAQAAINNGCDDETIIGALLHDIGHLCSDALAPQMGVYGTANHENIGAQFLKQRNFSPKVIALVQGHVLAKRYLTYKKPEYYNALSQASKETLKRQGGPMTPEEAQLFEASPYHKEILLVRSFDELAKDPTAHPQDLESYRSMIIKHLENNH